jgi:hypothetical protein
MVTTLLSPCRDEASYSAGVKPFLGQRGKSLKMGKFSWNSLPNLEKLFAHIERNFSIFLAKSTKKINLNLTY